MGEQRSSLANALWGRGAVAPVVPPERARALRVVIVGLGVFSGAVVGVVAGLLDGAVAGLVAATVTLFVVAGVGWLATKDMVERPD